MKIIISHDVDHLYVNEHLKKDLFVEKFFVKNLFYFLKGQISSKVLLSRIKMLFSNKMNRINELMEFDNLHNIPSTFFFGMENGLGMSYSIEQVKKIIITVVKNGFDVGVHGIDYRNRENMKTEFTNFKNIVNKYTNEFGIRMHYVRTNNNTYNLLSEIGYLFDSSRFNKSKTELLDPYKINNMWEFPLHIMDCYVCVSDNVTSNIKRTFDIIDEANKLNCKYCTILFHDYQYDDKTFPNMKKWYEEVVRYCENNNYSFVSFKEAIYEMETNYE